MPEPAALSVACSVERDPNPGVREHACIVCTCWSGFMVRGYSRVSEGTS